AGARLSRTLHRALSIYLFFSEHARAGGSGGAVLSGHFVSADAGGRALEGIRLADRAARGRAAGASGWSLLRAVVVLPRLCARLLSLCAVARGSEWNGNSTGV